MAVSCWHVQRPKGRMVSVRANSEIAAWTRSWFCAVTPRSEGAVWKQKELLWGPFFETHCCWTAKEAWSVCILEVLVRVSSDHRLCWKIPFMVFANSSARKPEECFGNSLDHFFLLLYIFSSRESCPVLDGSGVIASDQVFLSSFIPPPPTPKTSELWRVCYIMFHHLITWLPSPSMFLNWDLLGFRPNYLLMSSTWLPSSAVKISTDLHQFIPPKLHNQSYWPRTTLNHGHNTLLCNSLYIISLHFFKLWYFKTTFYSSYWKDLNLA